jgi:hypothetical protein
MPCASRGRSTCGAGAAASGCCGCVAGQPGVGKSAALAWCCLWDRPREAREREALWLHASALAPRTGWSESAVLWERWQRVPLLALDDLGVETCDPAVVQGLLLTRWDAGLVTLASTNAQWPEWKRATSAAPRATACGTVCAARRGTTGRPRDCVPS